MGYLKTGVWHYYNLDQDKKKFKFALDTGIFFNVKVERKFGKTMPHC